MLTDTQYQIIHALRITDLPPALQASWGRVEMVQRMRAARLGNANGCPKACRKLWNAAESVIMSRVDPSWIAW